MECPKCGKTVFEFTTQCIYCGTVIAREQSAADTTLTSGKEDRGQDVLQTPVAKPGPVDSGLSKSDTAAVEMPENKPVMSAPEPPAVEPEPEKESLFTTAPDTTDIPVRKTAAPEPQSGSGEPEGLFAFDLDAVDIPVSEIVVPETQAGINGSDFESEGLFTLNPDMVDMPESETSTTPESRPEPVEPEEEEEDSFTFDPDMFELPVSEPVMPASQPPVTDLESKLESVFVPEQANKEVKPEPQAVTAEPGVEKERSFRLIPDAADTPRNEPQSPADGLKAKPEAGSMPEPEFAAPVQEDKTIPAGQPPASMPGTVPAEEAVSSDKELLSIEKTVAMLAKMKGLLENGRFDADVYERMALDSVKDYLATLTDETRLIFVSYEIGDSALAPFLNAEMIEKLKVSVMDEISEK